jgi:tetrahydromethanopterin S-methyltransferase subunit G
LVNPPLSLLSYQEKIKKIKGLFTNCNCGTKAFCYTEIMKNIPTDSTDSPQAAVTTNELAVMILAQGQQINDLQTAMVYGFSEQGKRIDDLDKRIESLDSKIITVDISLGKRIDELAETVDKLAMITLQGFEKVDDRFKKVDERFDMIDVRFEKVDERFDDIEERLLGIENGFRKQRFAI